MTSTSIPASSSSSSELLLQMHQTEQKYWWLEQQLFTLDEHMRALQVRYQRAVSTQNATFCATIRLKLIGIEHARHVLSHCLLKVLGYLEKQKEHLSAEEDIDWDDVHYDL